MAAKRTNVAVGSVYRFSGLSGQETDERRITVLGVSVGGDVQYRIDMEGMPPGIHSASLHAVKILIEEGIWQEVKDDGKEDAEVREQ